MVEQDCGIQVDCDTQEKVDGSEYECTEWTTAFETCEVTNDCNGDPNGSAYYDNCGKCVGGNTYSQPCKDCNGDENGSAYLDNCGKCVDGNTGRQPCDCAGVEGGSAYTDQCGNCVGGTTGQKACSTDCQGDVCPICGGIVIIEDESDVGLRSATASEETSSCIKCTCLKKYKRTDECKAYAQMYNDAILRGGNILL